METQLISYTLISDQDDKENPSISENQLKQDLESGKDPVKIAAMKSVLAQMLNGESLNGVLMHVIRFVMPTKNKQLKKLCVLYWEICPKRLANGQPRPEMVLVCNALRNDLLHPNEFIRGQSLRFLCKLKEADILEPLIPSVRACIEHKHPYVRKNAVLAVYSIYKIHPHLLPDATELIQTYIASENDQSAKRNALLMLINCSLPLAVAYYHSIVSQIPNMDQGLQLIIIEMIRKDCRSPSADKAKYIQTVISLLSAVAPSVRYEAANTLVFLSNHSSALKAAINCYIELAVKESDNNVKLIVLNRIDSLRTERSDQIAVVDEFVMDILRVLTSPDLLVRKRALGIAMEMISTRNVDEVVTLLKKELVKTHEAEYEKNNEYRQLLIQSIHTCAIKFPSVAESVVHVLMDFLTDGNKVAAVDVIAFVKEVMERFPHLRSSIVESLLDSLPEMKMGRTLRGALWIIGEFADQVPLIESSMAQIHACLGSIPIIDTDSGDGMSPVNGETESVKVKSPSQSNAPRRVLADGTYATESAYSTRKTGLDADASKPFYRQPLRAMIFSGDFYVMTVLSTTLTKLSLRYSEIAPSESKANSFQTHAMLMMTSIIRAGKSRNVTLQIDEDSYSRIITCIRVLSSVPHEKAMVQTFLKDTKVAFGKLIQARENASGGKSKNETIKSQVDDVVSMRLLKPKKDVTGAPDQDVADILRATGAGDEEEVYVSRLDRIYPLTGYSDPIYAEAYITIHQFDILLDILIINQTKSTMQNLTIEFSALGDLKLAEKPTPQTIGPHGFHSIKVNFKVSSTESGIIFGNIVYDTSNLGEFNSVILNDIHIDIMDYIKPKQCSEVTFRTMWEEFEWENRIIASTPIKNLREYLDFLLATTNMKCLTPVSSLAGECGFLAANLYAQSIFGEDALANVCLEEGPNNSGVQGHIRIRSKTQGIALALGEKISAAQKNPSGTSGYFVGK